MSSFVKKNILVIAVPVSIILVTIMLGFFSYYFTSPKDFQSLPQAIGKIEKDKNKTEIKKAENISNTKNKLEEKHLRNYKILNDKIASLEEDKIILAKKANDEFAKLKDNLNKEKEKFEKLSKKLKISEISEADKEKLSKLELENDTLKEKINKLEVEHKDLLANNNLNDKIEEYKKQIILLEKENEKLRLKDKNISDFEEKLAYLEKENKNLIAKQENKIQKNPKKLVLIDEIQCTDLPAGNKTPTKECKNKVLKFLNKFDSSYFYEVIAIVDNGGFATFDKISKSKLNIPKSEIARLTRLSNLGLGKDRVVGGGEIIYNKFGDLARISYSPENLNIPKKRGFAIRVYE